MPKMLGCNENDEAPGRKYDGGAMSSPTRSVANAGGLQSVDEAGTVSFDALMRILDESLERLSWPAERQRAYLSGLGVALSLDELALEFDDALRPIAARYQELGIAEDTQEVLTTIDAKLAEPWEELEEASLSGRSGSWPHWLGGNCSTDLGDRE